MKLIIQKVKKAKVKAINSNVSNSINSGILVFVGISREYAPEKLDYIVKKTLNLRIFSSEKKGFDLSVSDIKGDILVVSQFTLHGIIDGNKPNFKNSADYEVAKKIYEEYVKKLKESGLKVETGFFGEMMEVELVNDGPTTIIVEK